MPDASVDELLAQLVYTDAHTPEGDTTPTILYALTDPQGTVVGLTNSAGHLVRQYAYTPHGELSHTDQFSGPDISPADLAAAASNRIGHQGLRLERLDAPWLGAMTEAYVASAPPTGPPPPFALYHNRNRMYSPAWGRFTARDPNALGAPVLNDLAFNGQPLTLSGLTPDSAAHYADGLNTHAAYGGNPLIASDPSGLFLFGTYASLLDDAAHGGGASDPFDQVYDYMVEEAAGRMLFLNTLTSRDEWINLGLAVASNAPIPIGRAAGVGIRAVRAAAGPSAKFAAAVTGRTVQLAGQTGRRLATWAGGHHLIPIYMRGALLGNRIPLTHVQHVEIHRLIDAAGKLYGIPTRSQGRAAVEAWLRANPVDGYIKMRAALIDAYSQFDRKHGTNTFALILKEMMDQTWMVR